MLNNHKENLKKKILFKTSNKIIKNRGIIPIKILKIYNTIIEITIIAIKLS